VCSIRIRDEDDDFLLLRLHGRRHPDATDFWDGNWLDCSAEVAAGAFRGDLRRGLRVNELESFCQQLAVLCHRLTGEAVLDSMEHWLRVRVTGDGRGHLAISCRLCDDPAFGNTLDCRLYFDQTFLPGSLRQLEQALHTYLGVSAPGNSTGRDAP
jgi:hypothetical protein